MKSSVVCYSAGLCCLAAVLFLVACGGGGGSTDLRIVQASPNAGSVNVLVNGTTVSSDLGYAGNTGYISVNSGSPSLEIIPTDSSTPIVNQNLSLGSGTETTVIVANFLANAEGLVLTDNNTDPPSGDVQIRVVNAAPGIASGADVYMIPSGSSLTTTAPLVTSLGFEQSSSYQTLTAGTYQVFFTSPGTKNAYLSTGQINLTTGQIRTIVALNGPTGGFTSITLADLN